MKLVDITTFFSGIKKSMGIERDIQWNSQNTWKSIDITMWNTLTWEGIDVDPIDIEENYDGTLEYKGHKVIVYIRDQSVRDEYDNNYKFHLSWCPTLDQMKRNNRFESRYVVTRRMDGEFIVNLFRFGEFIKEDKIPMRVCKNCLKKLGYKGYPEDKDEIYKTFSIKEYFDQFDSEILNLPPHTEDSAPLNVYSEYHDEIANSYKEQANWTCCDCKKNFSTKKKMLHIHHIDGDKSNYNPYNIEVVCKACHARKPLHGHMR